MAEEREVANKNIGKMFVWGVLAIIIWGYVLVQVCESDIDPTIKWIVANLSIFTGRFVLPRSVRS
jgi:hypothetical protein